jgi:hypothetical protein
MSNLELCRVEQDDPRRCQHTSAYGQCNYASADDDKGKLSSKYCPAHLPAYDPSKRKDIQLKRYKLSAYHSRVGELFKDEEFKSLREEIAILRMLLEQLMNQLQTPWDFMVYGNRVETVIEKIGKLTVMGHKLEASLGQVLDKPTLAAFSDEVIRILSEEVQDTETLKRISQKIGGAIERSSERAAATAQQRPE